MGQKANPISLRLSFTNKSFDSSWYSEHFYSSLIFRDISLHRYVTQFLKHFKLPAARLVINHLPKKTILVPFICYPKASRQIRSRNFQINGHLPSALHNWKKLSQKNRIMPFQISNMESSSQSFKNITNYQNKQQSYKRLTQDSLMWSSYNQSMYSLRYPISAPFTMTQDSLKKFLGTTLFLQENNKVSLLKPYQKEISWYSKHSIPLNTTQNLYILSKNWKNILTNIYLINSVFNIKNFETETKRNIHKYQTVTTKDMILSTILETSQTTNTELPFFLSSTYYQKKLKYKNYLEYYLGSKSKLALQFIPFQVTQDWQHAGYLADEIVYYLERRVPFRKIRNNIVKYLSQKSTIRGIRITCSGRVGGKSKKAQRAKTEYLKFGQTPLHVFSCHIDFAFRTAYTSFGSMGVKVWICYNI